MAGAPNWRRTISSDSVLLHGFDAETSISEASVVPVGGTFAYHEVMASAQSGPKIGLELQWWPHAIIE